MVTRVEMFKAVDGTLFEDKGMAEAHEKKVQYRRELGDILSRIGAHGEIESDVLTEELCYQSPLVDLILKYYGK